MDEELDYGGDMMGLPGGMGLEDRDRLYELLAGLSEEQLSALLDQSISDDLLGGAQEDQALGLANFSTPGAEGRNVGRSYVAANPLEHLAVAVRRSMGARGIKKAKAEESALFGKKRLYTKTVIDMLRAMQGQTPEPVPAMPEEYQGPPEPR
jgi:hypothetical protein